MVVIPTICLFTFFQLAKKRRDAEREKRLQATLDFAAHQKKFGLGIGRMMSQVVAAPSLIASDIGGGERRNSLGANAFERLRKITRSMRRKATSGSGKIARKMHCWNCHQNLTHI